MPRIQERPPDHLSVEEEAAVVALPDPLGLMCRVAIATGLRRRELGQLQASHFQNGVLVVSNTKSAKVRRVPVPEELARELRGRVGLLFPFVATSPDHTARRIRRLSGVVGFRLHRLRHTFANRWLVYGGSIEALRVVMGHSTVSVTERYGRLSDANVREQASRIEQRKAGIR